MEMVDSSGAAAHLGLHFACQVTSARRLRDQQIVIFGSKRVHNGLLLGSVGGRYWLAHGVQHTLRSRAQKTREGTLALI